MALPEITGKIDPVLGYIVPVSTGTWAATTGTWDTLSSWTTLPANPLIWVSDLADFTKVGWFNIKISSQWTGNLTKFEIYTSTTGAFQGEETVTTIYEGDENIPAFYGRYVKVAAYVYNAGAPNTLQQLQVTLTDNQFHIVFADVVSSALPTWSSLSASPSVSSARVLDIGRKISKIVLANITPQYISPPVYVTLGYAISGYITSGYQVVNDQLNYFERIDYSGICAPSIVSKSVSSSTLVSEIGLAFILQDQNGDVIDNTVDIRVSVLPEQYMLNGQVLVR